MTKSALTITREGNLSSSFAPLVFLPGWGSTSEIWRHLSAFLVEQHELIFIDLPGFGNNAAFEVDSLEHLYCSIENAVPSPCHLIGWSLGAMVAVELAARDAATNKGGVLSLSSIAANAKFSASKDWPLACHQNVTDEFVATFTANPAMCVKKFTQLQAFGDTASKDCVKFLRSLTVDYSVDAGISKQHLQSLGFLDSIDNRQSLQTLSLPRLSILGERDNLVPSAVAEVFKAEDYFSSVNIVPGAAHVPHLSFPQEVAALIQNNIQIGTRKLYSRQKQRVAEAFSAAAAKYDSVAALQKRVASRLLSMHKERWGEIQGTVCDIGSGTGFCAEEIPQKQCELVGLDIAFGMLQHCRNNKRYKKDQLVCADFDSLPFNTACFDGAISSMSLQWSENLAVSFKEIRQILKAENRSWFSFSTLGPKTLHELSASWQAVDRYVHVNRFDSQAVVKDCLHEAGFSLRQHKVELEVLAYDSVMALMKDLKSIGAHNTNAGNKTGLTTRHQLRLLAAAYEDYRRQNSLPATYEVFYFLAESRV